MKDGNKSTMPTPDLLSRHKGFIYRILLLIPIAISIVLSLISPNSYWLVLAIYGIYVFVTTRKGLNKTGVMLLITISLFVLLYLIASLMFANSNFAKYSVLFNLLNLKAYLLMLALGVTVVLITGSIDISVGRVAGLISMVIAVMLTDSGVSALWAIPVSLGIGLAFGIVQGFLVAYMEIQPFIVTLSGLFFCTGYDQCARFRICADIQRGIPELVGGSVYSVFVQCAQ